MVVFVRPLSHSRTEFKEQVRKSHEVKHATQDFSREGRAETAKDLEAKEQRDTLYEAIRANDWSATEDFFHEDLAETAVVTYTGKSALHVAALFGHVDMVKKLVALVPPEHLETTDIFGNTPLLIATVTGVTQVAECLVNKNRTILGIPNPASELPVTLAFLNGHEEMGRYLYEVTPLECLEPSKGPHGPMLLRCCLQSLYLDIVLDLLQQCEELLFATDKDEWKPIMGIAAMNSAFLDERELVLLKRWIYKYINVESTTTTQQVRRHTQQEDKSERAQRKMPGIKEVHELKWLHAKANQILSLVCNNVKKSDKVILSADALLHAAKEGNVEFVLQVSKANPEILFIGDSSSRNIFLYAVEYRQAEVFNLIHGLRFKDAVTTSKDEYGNTLLHMAAIMAPASHLNRIYGPTLQMQRELQWFKEVKSVVPPTIRVARNNDGMTPAELFRESHKKLMKEGEKWIKETASYCSVVGTLVVTIMFAAAFTVPGGNNQDSGYPIFLKEPFFMLFIFSTILSLLTSSTSVLMFLGILTSRYSEEYFLKSLPLKLIIGLSSLFISITTMIIAFLAEIRLMLKQTNYSWGLLPVIILKSIPVSLFMLSQFPLLSHTTFSTYGGFFNRKVEKWP